MKREADIQKNVQQALDSLHGLQRAEANPFLHTRVMARLNARKRPVTGWDIAARWIARPAFAVAIVVTVLLANFAVLNDTKAKKMQAKEEVENILSAEYATSNMYSLESVADR